MFSESCPVFNKSDNRDLYIHLDSMTPLKVAEDDSISHDHHDHQDHPYFQPTVPTVPYLGKTNSVNELWDKKAL